MAIWILVLFVLAHSGAALAQQTGPGVIYPHTFKIGACVFDRLYADPQIQCDTEFKSAGDASPKSSCDVQCEFDLPANRYLDLEVFAGAGADWSNHQIRVGGLTFGPSQEPGFRAALPASAVGTQAVYASAVCDANCPELPAVMLDPLNLSVNVVPQTLLGGVRGIVVDDEERHLEGWACSQGFDFPVGVDLASHAGFGGNTFRTLNADQVSSEPGVAQCQSGSTAHGFRLLITDSLAERYVDKLVHARARTDDGEVKHTLPGSGSFYLNRSPQASITASTPAPVVGQSTRLFLGASDPDLVNGDYISGTTLTKIRNGQVVSSTDLGAGFPPHIDWTPGSLETGLTTFTFKARDRYNVERSASVQVNVTTNGKNVSPTLSVATPFDTQQVIQNTPIIFSGYAQDPDGFITQVKVTNLQNGAITSITTSSGLNASTGYFERAVTGISQNTAFRVQAIDNRSGGSTLVTRNLTVAPPSGVGTIEITHPSELARFYQGQTVDIWASPEDSDGIASVQIFVDGAALGGPVGYPYMKHWTASTPGPHRITARMHDNLGNVVASTVRTIEVLAEVSDEKSDPLVPPAASLCAIDTQPVAPGSTPTTPGTWWNPRRHGTGWEFIYQVNDTGPPSLIAYWFTFDRRGRPTWLQSQLNSFEPSDGSWNSQLYSYRWNFDEDRLNGASAAVGRVTITPIPGDPTRAAIRWQWDEVDGGSSAIPFDECIQDFSRVSDPSDGTQSPPGEPGVLQVVDNTFGHANTTFNGGWNETGEGAWSGYGMFITMAQPGSGGVIGGGSEYMEVVKAAIYDDNGYPVWLLGTATASSNEPPPIDDPQTLNLSYMRSAYPQGVPIVPCGPDVLPRVDCFTEHANAGSWWRTYRLDVLNEEPQIIRPRIQSHLTVQTTSASVDPALPVSTSGPTHVTMFDRPEPGEDPVDLLAYVGKNQILADTSICIVPTNGTTCPVVVNWRADDHGNARPYRVDCDTGAATVLPDTANYGEALETLTLGECVWYELRSGAPVHKTLFRTHEIWAVSAGTQLQPTASIRLPKNHWHLEAGEPYTVEIVPRYIPSNQIAQVTFYYGDSEGSINQHICTAVAGSMRCEWPSVPATPLYPDQPATPHPTHLGYHHIRALVQPYVGQDMLTDIVYVTAGNGPPAIETVHFYHTNAQGSVVAVTNSSGNVVSDAFYHPFGTQREIGGTPTSELTKLGFTGKRHDAELGLIYFGARHYDPLLTRFTSIDPAEFRQDDLRTFGRYGYAFDNPMGFVDPDGRMPGWLQRLKGQQPDSVSASDKFATESYVGALEHQVQREIETAPQQAQEVGELVLLSSMVLPPVRGAYTAGRGGMYIGRNAGRWGFNVGDAADAAFAAGKRGGAAGEYQFGEWVITAPSGTIVAQEPRMIVELMAVRGIRVPPWHGACAEVACVELALRAGLEPSGGRMRAVNVGGGLFPHGSPKPWCESCQAVLPMFGISPW